MKTILQWLKYLPPHIINSLPRTSLSYLKRKECETLYEAVLDLLAIEYTPSQIVQSKEFSQLLADILLEKYAIPYRENIFEQFSIGSSWLMKVNVVMHTPNDVNDCVILAESDRGHIIYLQKEDLKLLKPINF